jgi:hypothetical protein
MKPDVGWILWLAGGGWGRATGAVVGAVIGLMVSGLTPPAFGGDWSGYQNDFAQIIFFGGLIGGAIGAWIWSTLVDWAKRQDTRA